MKSLEDKIIEALKEWPSLNMVMNETEEKSLKLIIRSIVQVHNFEERNDAENKILSNPE